jgi:hypothetical protein
VAAGTAVDAAGRQIVLPETKSKDLQDWSQDKYIYIAYRQAEDDEQQAEQGISDYTRWLETPHIFLLDDKLSVGDTYHDADTQQQYRPVCLGRIKIKKTGAGFDATPEGRIYSGLRLPGPAAAAWRSDEKGLSLWRTRDGVSKRQLTVTEEGLLGLGTESPQAGLEINTASNEVGLKVTKGEAKFENGLSVTGGESHFYQNVTISDGLVSSPAIEVGETDRVRIKAAPRVWARWLVDTMEQGTNLGQERENTIRERMTEDEVFIGTTKKGKLFIFWRDEEGTYFNELTGTQVSSLNFRGTACPFVFTYDHVNQQWRFDTTIIYKIVGAENEMVQQRPLQRFDGRLLIREVEPEISYLDEVYVVATHDDGRETVLRHTFAPLHEANDTHYVMRQGDEITLHFPDYPNLTNVNHFAVVAKGYYVPLSGTEEANRETAVAAAP